MKKRFILLVVSILFIGLCVQSQTKNKNLNEFVTDLASMNVKLRGQLMLFGEYKDDMSTLTYSRYLEYLKKITTKSNKEVAELIKCAEKHIFAVKKNSFLIAIYSKKLNVVLYDDANTTVTDSIMVLPKNASPPDLIEFIKKTGYKIAKE